MHAATLDGTVTDPQGKPVSDTSLTLISTTSGSRWSAASNTSGAYRFDNVSAGEYILQADSPGFATFLKQPVRLSADSTQTQDVTLEIAGLRQNVVVTASSTPQAPGDLSKSVTVIDQSETTNRDAPDLARALDLVPGVRVQHQGGPGALSEIQIRGLRPEDTAVLVNGTRFRDASATQADASAFLEDFLLTNSSRVEVLRGSGSSLYGTNAIGGVVNVITDEGGGRTRGSVLLEGGSLGLFRGRAQFAGGWHDDRFQYSAAVAQMYVGNGVDGDDPYRDTSAEGGVTIHFSPSTRLTARLYGANAFGKLNSSPDILGTPPGTGILPAVPNVTFLPAPDNPDYTRAGRFLTGSLTLAGQPTETLSYSVSYQAMVTSRRYGDGPAGYGYQPLGSTRSVYDGRIHTVNAHADYRLGRHNLLTAGYEFESENYANDNVDASNPEAASAVDVTQHSNAVFVQDQVRLFGDRLQLSGAFRAQFFSLQAPGFAPAAAAPFQGIAFPAPAAAYTGDGSAAYSFPASGTRLHAHLGRGYRAPSLFERFGAGYDPTFGYSVYGDPRLTPEHSLGLDAGVEQTLWHGRWKASATYFYTWLQNVITFDTSSLINSDTDPFGRFIGYVNTRGGISRGVELASTVSPVGPLTIATSYTFANADERVPIVGDTIRTFVIPRNQFSILATGQVTKRLLVTLDALVSGNYLAPIYGEAATQVYRFDGRHNLGLGGSYRLPFSEHRAMRFFARMDNLLAQEYYEVGFPTPGRTGRAGAQFEW